MMKNGVCALCRQTAKLCESHLASNFLYKEAMDDPNGRAKYLSTEQRRDRTIGTGIYDWLLCQSCELFLSNNFETPFADFWINNNALDKAVANSNGLYAVVTGYDYKVFKLFHLSVLWRFAVSKGEYAKNFDIGLHADTLRDMILKADPGSEDAYPFFGQCILDPQRKKVQHAMVGMFKAGTYESTDIAVGVYGGCEWTFFLTPKMDSSLQAMKDAFPCKSGRIFIPIRRMEDVGSVQAFVKQRRMSPPKKK